MPASLLTIAPDAARLPAEDLLRQSFALAAQAQRTGDLAGAERLYQAILAADPAHADALHGLGTLAHQVGRSDIAADLIGQAIARRDEPMFHNNLGVALLAQGKFPEALAAHRRALELKPAYPEAFHALGNAQMKLGRRDEAIAAYSQALALRPTYVDALCNLGKALQESGENDAAEQACRRALELTPHCAEAHNTLGIVLRAQGRFDEALECFDRALASRPAYAEAHSNRGNVLEDLDRQAEALDAYSRALRLKPDFPEALTGSGLALRALGRPAEAMDAWREAIRLVPDCFEALCFLGREATLRYLPSEAIACFERAVAIKPDFAVAHSNIGTGLLIDGRPGEALPAYDRTIALMPDWAQAHSNRIMAMNYIATISNAEILAAARAFGDRFDQPDRRPHATGPLSTDRRLRIGYVSGDFILHAVGFFLAPVLAARDRRAVEIFCYSNNPVVDEMTAQLQQASDHWRAIHDLSDAEAAEVIRADGIDILVDLSGHTDKSRLPLFGLKPAPVQASWIGYFGTTGMKSIDYILLDPVSAPPGAEGFYSESVVRLPHGRFTHLAPPYTPEVADPPCLTKNFVTFGSFNNVAKIGPEVIRVWAEILRANPRSRLLLKWMSFQETQLRRRFLAAFAAHGIAEDRIELRGPSSHRDSMLEYRDLDIALDPFPFCGGLTSCDCLLMGVPIVTLPDERLASRQTLAFLAQMGMADLAAASPEDYVAKATALAGDPGRLRELRAALRPAFQTAPFNDPARFTSALEAAYKTMWRRHCEGLAPAAIDGPAL